MQVTLTPEVEKLAAKYIELSSKVYAGFHASTTTVINHMSKNNLEAAIATLEKTLKKK